jgi:hypothetical protein
MYERHKDLKFTGKIVQRWDLNPRISRCHANFVEEFKDIAFLEIGSCYQCENFLVIMDSDGNQKETKAE